MKCKYCGKDLVEGAKFCVYCGKPVEEEKIDLPIEEPEIVETPIEENRPVDVNVTEENEVKIEQAPIDQNVEVNVEPTPIELPKEEPEPIVEPAPVQPEIPQPTIENTTKVVVKRNNPILLIIIILILLAILGVGGFYVYKNYIEKDNKSSNNNTETTDITETTDATEEKEYDKVKAKELVDKYYYEFLWDNIFTFEDGYTDVIKSVVATKNIENSKSKTTSCAIYDNNSDAKKDNNSYTVTLKSDVFNLKYAFGGCDNYTTDYYEYEDLNKTYKNLFGNSVSIPKSDFSSGYVVYDYIESENIFVKLDCRCGGAGPFYNNYFIKTAKVSGESLVVDVGYVDMDATDDTLSSNDPVFETTIAGEKVTYKQSETKKGTFEKEFTDKYLDKLDTYEFTFKYEDDHYVFVDMKKK